MKGGGDLRRDYPEKRARLPVNLLSGQRGAVSAAPKVQETCYGCTSFRFGGDIKPDKKIQTFPGKKQQSERNSE